MTAYYSNKYFADGTVKALPRFLPYASGVSVLSTFAVAVALATADTIKMLEVPGQNAEGGAWVTDIKLQSPDLDTGGTPTIVLDLGTTGSTTLFISSSTIGQAGGIVTGSAVVNGSIGYQFTDQQSIFITVKSGPQTGATTVTIKLLFSYTFDP